MSSGQALLVGLGLRYRFISEESTEHFVRNAPPQQSHGLGLAVTGCQTHSNVRLPATSDAHLNHRNAMQGRVDLSVTAAVQPLAIAIARPDGNWGGAIPASEGGLRAKPGGTGGFPDELGS